MTLKSIQFWLLAINPLLALEVRPLESFALSSRIWVGSEKAVFAYTEEKEYRSTSDLKLHLIANNNDWLDKGDHWATRNPERLEHQKRSQELELLQTEIKIDKLEDENVDKLLQLEKQYSELEAKVLELQEALNLKTFPKEMRVRITKAIERLQKQQERIQRKFDNDYYLEESKYKKVEYKNSIKGQR